MTTVLAVLRDFWTWLTCPCPVDQHAHRDHPTLLGWSQSWCQVCDRSWLHFRDLAIPVRRRMWAKRQTVPWIAGSWRKP